jgi:hypothetical protein
MIPEAVGGYADDVVSGDLLETGARLPLLA